MDGKHKSMTFATDLAAQAGCWWHFEDKNWLDSRLNRTTNNRDMSKLYEQT
jgi:hypothetical protein